MTKAKLYFVRMETSNRGPIACGHFLGLDNADACRRAEISFNSEPTEADYFAMPEDQRATLRKLIEMGRAKRAEGYVLFARPSTALTLFLANPGRSLTNGERDDIAKRIADWDAAANDWHVETMRREEEARKAHNAAVKVRRAQRIENYRQMLESVDTGDDMIRAAEAINDLSDDDLLSFMTMIVDTEFQK